MKKILILFLLTTSLGFSANYKVEVKPNVKIQQSEIEKKFNNFMKNYLNNGIKNVKNEIKKIQFN